MRDKILIFGGTTEGREFADILSKSGVPHVVSVATEYGAEILSNSGEDNLLVGRKSAEEIAVIIREGGFNVVVDATHPFATVASKEIKAACTKENVRYMRLKRNTSAHNDSAEVVGVSSVDEAADILKQVDGNILLMTGSKDLGKLADLIGDRSRIYARVLPNADSIKKCEEAGLAGRQIIAMQGPFSVQMNIALIKETDAKVIFTKESGKTGGFTEKLEAAKVCKIKTVVLTNPEEAEDSSDKYSMEKLVDELAVMTGTDNEPSDGEKSITLAGIGPGDNKYHTAELDRVLKKTDVIFGAKTVVSRLEKLTVPVYKMYKAADILKVLEDHHEYRNPLVVFSGDISLCSGAKEATTVFSEKGYKVERISGISSVTLFAERLGLSLEEVRIISAHGRECNVTAYADCESKLIVLPSEMTDALDTCRKLREMAGEDEDRFTVKIGFELGTERERIFDAFKGDEDLFDLKGKCLIYIENNRALGRKVGAGIRDDEMIRGKIPMTKEEIRALTIKKLELTEKSVLYDIGAGTGSISIEASRLAPGIEVYSIERKGEALSLIEQNKDKFSAENIHIVEGEAPEALKDMPVPTHVFIGGSGGKLREIVAAVRDLNENARIVMNCVTPETLSEAVNVAKEFNYDDPDIIQVSINRFRKAGEYHIADAQNPVYIIRL